jgi:hypothetical protein
MLIVILIQLWVLTLEYLEALEVLLTKCTCSNALRDSPIAAVWTTSKALVHRNFTTICG